MNTVVIDNKTYNAIAAYAKHNNVSISEAVSAGMRVFLKNFKAPAKPMHYYISSAVKALETDFKCPDDLSSDYKKEIAEARVEKYL